jgi:hypothetical protein
MTKILHARHVVVLAALAASTMLAKTANAADCPAFTNPVYVTGSSASQPVLASIAGVLAAAAAPVTVVYIKTESCQGVTSIVTPAAAPANATYWPGGVATTCTIAAGSQTVDVGVSDVFPSTCPNITLPATQTDYQGPVQAMTFVVHPSSTETSISSEAARVVLKYAGTGSYALSPWSDVNNLFIRPGGATGSGTRAMIGTAVGLNDGDWKGTVKAGSADVLAAVAGASAAANASLGILSVTLADKNRVGGTGVTTPVKVLTFQAKNQACGYFPDSSSTSFDKLNVREGRYAIWGPLHFIANTSGGKPVSAANPGTGDAAVQQFIDYVTMNKANAAITAVQKTAIIDATAAAKVIPQCAMRVRRNAEVGAEASFVPDESCGCYWESKANGTAPASCKACPGGDGDCAGTPSTPTCRYGFCEAK